MSTPSLHDQVTALTRQRAQKRADCLNLGGPYVQQYERKMETHYDGLRQQQQEENQRVEEINRQYDQYVQQKKQRRSAFLRNLVTRLTNWLPWHKAPAGNAPQTPAAGDLPPQKRGAPQHIYDILYQNFGGDEERVLKVIRKIAEVQNGKMLVLGWDRCGNCQALEASTQLYEEENGQLFGFKKVGRELVRIPSTAPEFIDPSIGLDFKVVHAFSDPDDPHTIMRANSPKMTDEQRLEAEIEEELRAAIQYDGYPFVIAPCGQTYMGLSGPQNIRKAHRDGMACLVNDQNPPTESH